MTELQAIELIEQNEVIIEYLTELTSLGYWFLTIGVPGVLISWFFWWVLKQFIHKY
jgi:hypothetical protein